jgi:hypothetical protein
VASGLTLIATMAVKRAYGKSAAGIRARMIPIFRFSPGAP